MASQDGRATGFIDSHAHLADAAFTGDRNAVISRARDAGAGAIVCIGESIAVATIAAECAADNPGFIFATAGVHPHDAASFDAQHDIPKLRGFLEGGAVAVGECGLDYHYDNSPRAAQREAFSAQIALAHEMKRPIVVHTRDAEDDTRAAIGEARSAGVIGVLHCYTGTQSLAEFAIASGWYVSFAGIVTFKKWTDDDLIRIVPADRLLVESDSPYLAPVPYRGKRNEPAWVPQTLAKLATVRRHDPQELGSVTAANARRLFGLAFSAA
jgi:TatD DNase family protein